MSDFNYIFELEDEDKTYEVELNIEYIIDNDGIGWYEYWGSKFYDRGQNSPVVEDYSIVSVFEVIGGKSQTDNLKDNKSLEKLIDFHYTHSIDKITESIELNDPNEDYED